MSGWEYYDKGEVIVWKQILQAVFFGAAMSYANITALKRAQNISEKKESDNKKQ